MLGGLGDLMGLLKQAKSVKERMEQLQAQLAERRYEADAGAGGVVARVNGAGDLVSIRIRPDLLASGPDAEMLEDLVRAAVNAALLKSRNSVREEMAQLTAGLNLPGLDLLRGPASAE